MVKRRGIIRGRLFREPLAPRQRLVYVRDLFDWVYAKGKSLAELQEEGLSWWFGVTPEQARKETPEQWDKILEHTKHWKWPDLQSQLREKLERIFLPKPGAKELEPVRADRRLGVFAAPDGETYFYYHTKEFPLPDENQWPAAVIDRTLQDLHDLSTRVIERCGECGRLFVRLRPSVGRYCSPGCRHLAYLKAHGFKPPTEAARKPQRKGAEPKPLRKD